MSLVAIFGVALSNSELGIGALILSPVVVIVLMGLFSMGLERILFAALTIMGVACVVGLVLEVVR